MCVSEKVGMGAQVCKREDVFVREGGCVGVCMCSCEI